jgi:alpha-mannosidase
LPLAEENVLRNEYFEAIIDERTGAVRAINDFHGRHPRLAQQIALRTPLSGERDEAGELHYSVMSADEIRVAATGPVMGEIVSKGKLCDRQGSRLAGFKQTARAWRDSRILELEIELDAERLPGPNPWNSYYACRFAWHDETCKIFRGVNSTTQPADVSRLESPQFIDIRSDSQRTTILCGGLPYHRKLGLRKLDTLLVVQGETARRFRLGVGIDLPNAMTAALDFLAPQTICFPSAMPPTKHGWLFHLDRRNVIASRWAPIFGEDRVQGSGFRVQHPFSREPQASEIQEATPAHGLGSAIGFCVRLMETEGRPARLGLRSFRTIARASKIEPESASLIDLTVETDRISIDIGPYQSIDVEAFFQ